jgi:hypothetical protein
VLSAEHLRVCDSSLRPRRPRSEPTLALGAQPDPMRGSDQLTIHSSEKARSCKRIERFASNHRIETKALPRNYKEPLHENQKDVEPRPFFRLGSRISAVRPIRVILLRPAQAGSAGDGTSSMARLTPWRPSARRSRSIARWSGRASCRERKKALIRTRDQQDNNRDQSPMRGNPEIHRRHLRCAFGVMPVIKAKGSISLAKS